MSQTTDSLSTDSGTGNEVYPAEVIIEGHHMQKVSVRFHKSMMSSDASSQAASGRNSATARDALPLWMSPDANDNQLPFPHEVSRSSSSKYDSDDVITDRRPIVDEIDLVKKATDDIRHGVTYLEKHLDLETKRLRADLQTDTSQRDQLQHQLNEVIRRHVQLETDNTSLKEELSSTKSELDRLREKEVIDLRRRHSIEEKLVKLSHVSRENGSAAERIGELELELRKTRDELDKIRQQQNKTELENQTPTSSGRNHVIGDQQSTTAVSVIPLALKLQNIRREKTALLASTLPATALHFKRHQSRPTDDVINPRNAVRSIVLPMIAKPAVTY